MSTSLLSCTRKGDRNKMAKQVVLLAHSLDATASIRIPSYDLLAVYTDIETKRNLHVTIEFNRHNRTDIWVLNWHIANDKFTKLNPSFAGVNTYHFGKATWIAYGFTHLLEQIQRGIELATNGKAFQN